MLSLRHRWIRHTLLTLSSAIASCSNQQNSTTLPEFTNEQQEVAPPSDSDSSSPQAPTDNKPDGCAKAPLAAKMQSGLRYQSTETVDDNLQSLDIYMPDVKDPCTGVPVVIWVHGGAWMFGDKSQVRYKAAHFNELGFGFVSINYRLSPEVSALADIPSERIRFPDHPNDVGAAISWVHNNISSHGGNPNKIALLGHSAGAHLAALVGLNQTYISNKNAPWNPTALRCVGSYDTEGYDIPKVIESASGTQLVLYRNAFGFNPVDLSAASPINHIKQGVVPMQLALRGDQQRHERLQEFKDALEAQQGKVFVINAQTLSHEEVNRQIGNPEDRVMTPEVTKFIQEICFP